MFKNYVFFSMNVNNSCAVANWGKKKYKVLGFTKIWIEKYIIIKVYPKACKGNTKT